MEDILGKYSFSHFRVALYQCTHSDTKYIGLTDGTDTSEYSEVCKNDPRSYQICGAHSKPNPSHTGELCQNNICLVPDEEKILGLRIKAIKTDVLCGRKPCGQHTCPPRGGCSNLNVTEDFCLIDNKTIPTVQLPESGLSAPLSAICNGVCDLHYRCDDEAFCGGYMYGMYCPHLEMNKSVYIAPKEICNEFDHHFCRNREDEAYCPDLDSLPSTEKCESAMYGIPQMIPILNNTRCSAVWWGDFTNTLDQQGIKPLCKNYMDQTNCTDQNR